MVDISPVVRNKALSVGATAWLAGLDDLVHELERAWNIQVEEPFLDGTEAFVAAARSVDGTEAVLKVLVPRADDVAGNEIRFLELAHGEGCAELLRADVDRGAMLLERLGPSLFELGTPFDTRLEIMVATARRIWRPAPDAGFPDGATKGRALAAFIETTWQALDRPVPERVVEYALECAARRVDAHDDNRALLAHGDVHQWNTLRTLDGSDYKLVDPDGLLIEPEYDLGVLMREDPLELLRGDPRDRSRRLAAMTGLDENAIWEWGVVERVSTGLLCVQVELQPVGTDMLRAADHATGFR